MQFYQTFSDDDEDQMNDYAIQIMNSNIVDDSNENDLCDKTCYLLTIVCIVFLGLVMIGTIWMKIF